MASHYHRAGAAACRVRSIHQFRHASQKGGREACAFIFCSYGVGGEEGRSVVAAGRSRERGRIFWGQVVAVVAALFCLRSQLRFAKYHASHETKPNAKTFERLIRFLFSSAEYPRNEVTDTASMTAITSCIGLKQRSAMQHCQNEFWNVILNFLFSTTGVSI